jgi:hypothetical protein
MFREDLEKLQIRAILYSKYSIKSIVFSVLNLAGRKYLLGHKTCTFLNKSVASESTNRHSDINCKELSHRTVQGNLVLNNGQNAPLTLLTLTGTKHHNYSVHNYNLKCMGGHSTNSTKSWDVTLHYKLSNSTNSQTLQTPHWPLCQRPPKMDLSAFHQIQGGADLTYWITSGPLYRQHANMDKDLVLLLNKSV